MFTTTALILLMDPRLLLIIYYWLLLLIKAKNPSRRCLQNAPVPRKVTEILQKPRVSVEIRNADRVLNILPHLAS